MVDVARGRDDASVACSAQVGIGFTAPALSSPQEVSGHLVGFRRLQSGRLWRSRRGGLDSRPPPPSSPGGPGVGRVRGVNGVAGPHIAALPSPAASGPRPTMCSCGCMLGPARTAPGGRRRRRRRRLPTLTRAFAARGRRGSGGARGHSASRRAGIAPRMPPATGWRWLPALPATVFAEPGLEASAGRAPPAGPMSASPACTAGARAARV